MATGVRDGEQVEVEDRSLGELFSEMGSEVSQLVRSEIDLAKAELKEEASKVAKAGAVLGAGGFIAYLAVILLSFAAAWGLATAIPEGFAFLIIGTVYVVIAVVCFLVGRQRLQEFSPVPQETVETIKEDVQWARARKS
jgi:uncharacterized membrane protein YqjE